MHFLSCGGELNHHGRYMCDSIYNLLGENYKRITTSKVNSERKNLGYYDMGNDVSYNITQSSINPEEVRKIVSWCDVMDYGAAPEIYLHEAVRQKKIVFIRIERLLKEGSWKLLLPHILMRYYKKYIQYRNNSKVYFLCVSAYAANDLRRIGINNNRLIQWAYCPEFIPLDRKQWELPIHKLEITWIGRMIWWKHPYMAVKIAVELKKLNVPYHLSIIGDGYLLQHIKDDVNKLGLSLQVSVLGAIPASNIRSLLQQSDIMLATSDRNEGWGVVINEGMNSGCVVIATEEMGAVPVLINDKQNGIIIRNRSVKNAAKEIQLLYNNPSLLASIKQKAYETIEREYSPNVYARTFVELANDAINGSYTERTGLGRLIK